jgi:hypothetical protein
MLLLHIPVVSNIYEYKYSTKSIVDLNFKTSLKCDQLLILLGIGKAPSVICKIFWQRTRKQKRVLTT